MNYNSNIFTYSDMQNTLRDTTDLDAIFSSGIPSQEQTLTGINNYLSLTNLKRACCRMGTNQQMDVDIRLPISSTADSESILASSLGNYEQKYNFIDKTVTITANQCSTIPGYTLGAGQCDYFYNTYCDNIINEFNTLTGGNNTNFDYNGFSFYKPECACYAPPPAAIVALQKQNVSNAKPSCYLPGCEVGSTAFLDPQSRETQNVQCTDMTICLANFNVGENQISSGGVNVNSTIQQNCGGSSSKTTTAPTITTSPTSPTITTTNTNNNTTTPTPTNTTQNNTLNPQTKPPTTTPTNTTSATTTSSISTTDTVYIGISSSACCCILIIIIIAIMFML